MKKSIFLFFAAILCAIGMNAAGTTPNRLYMKRDWQTDNAWFAAYFFGNGDKWVKMTDLGSGLYTCETPQDKAYTSVIFCRMDGSKQNNLSWDAKWEQTSDLTLSASKDFYKKTSWTTFEPTIAGDGVLLGESWTPGSSANKMTKQNNGTYTLVKEGMTLEKNAYEYKVTDGSWDWSVGKNGNNASLSINAAGTYNVTFTYTPSSNTVSAAATPIYTITASANPATAGTITGTGTYAKGASVTLEATPNAGYKFVNWTVGGVEKSTDAKYSFTASADVTAVANFELSDPEVPTYAISVSANNDAMGTVTGAGDYTEGSLVTLTATPNAGYRFVNWTVGSEVKSTEATYSFTASEALTIVANFEAIPKYDITVKAVVPEAWTSATIGIHYWGDGISGTSTPVATEKEGNWNKYTIKDVLEGQSVNVIFLNGTSWTDDKSKQTANITGITEDKCFQISAKTLDGEGKCTFTEVDCAADIKPETDIYTIVGSSAELGLEWDPAKEANDMEKQGDGSYKKVYSNVELTSDVEWKIAKNDNWWNETPLENKADNGNSVLVIAKSGIYNVTFTLSADLKTAHAEAELLEETNTVADCFISGNAALTGGAGWAGNEFKMEYDPATETYSYTLTGLAASTAYEIKVVCGGVWYSFDKLVDPAPANVTKGNDNSIAFTLATAGDVTVTYHATNGINLTGSFVLAPLTYTVTVPAGTEKCYICGAWDWETFKEMTPTANENEFTIDIVGAKSTDEYKYACQADWAYAEVIEGGGNRTEWSALDEVTAWNAPAEPAKCYLMGNGDWENGVEMTLNPENDNEFVLYCHHISAPFKFKYGEEWSDQVENYDFTGIAWVDGNIELPEGCYSFYFKKDSKKVYIAECTPTTYDVTLSGMVATPNSRMGSYRFLSLDDEDGNQISIFNGTEGAYGDDFEVNAYLAAYDVTVSGTGDWNVVDGVETLTATLQACGAIYNLTATVAAIETYNLPCDDAHYYKPNMMETIFVGEVDGETLTVTIESMEVGENYSVLGMYGETDFLAETVTVSMSNPTTYALEGEFKDATGNIYNVSMTATPLPKTPVVVENATYTEVDGDIIITGDWSGTELTVTLYGYATSDNVLYEEAEMETDDIWAASTEVTLNKTADAFTITGEFIHGWEAAIYNVTISGTLPVAAPDYTRTTTAGKFGTICLPFGSTNYTGATFYEFVGSETGKVYLGSVTTLEAGVPYIFLATGTELAVYSDGTTDATPGNHNGLHGTFTDNTEVAVGNYILKDNALHQAAATCYVNANRAYIVMSEVPTGVPTKMPGRRYIGMSVQGENEATGFENLTAPEGQVIKAIVNGQLIIIRDGVKYNVQGQVIR